MKGRSQTELLNSGSHAQPPSWYFLPPVQWAFQIQQIASKSPSLSLTPVPSLNFKQLAILSPQDWNQGQKAEVLINISKQTLEPPGSFYLFQSPGPHCFSLCPLPSVMPKAQGPQRPLRSQFQCEHLRVFITSKVSHCPTGSGSE